MAQPCPNAPAPAPTIDPSLAHLKSGNRRAVAAKFHAFQDDVKKKWANLEAHLTDDKWRQLESAFATANKKDGIYPRLKSLLDTAAASTGGLVALDDLFRAQGVRCQNEAICAAIEAHPQE